MELSRVERQILNALAMALGYRVVSLYALCTELELDYSNAWRATRALEARGYVQVSRAGRDLSLTLFKSSKPSGSNRSGGGVERIKRHISRNTKGETMEEDIQSIRNTLPDQSGYYPRPELTSDEGKKYSNVAKKINGIQDSRLRLVYLTTIVCENVRLLREVNEHRRARGLDPLPEYDPENTR